MNRVDLSLLDAEGHLMPSDLEEEKRSQESNLHKTIQPILTHHHHSRLSPDPSLLSLHANSHNPTRRRNLFASFEEHKQQHHHHSKVRFKAVESEAGGTWDFPTAEEYYIPEYSQSLVPDQFQRMDSLLVTNYPQIRAKQSGYPPVQAKQPSIMTQTRQNITLNQTRLQAPNPMPGAGLSQTKLPPSNKLVKTLEERKPAPLLKSERRLSQPEPHSKASLPSPRKSSLKHHSESAPKKKNGWTYTIVVGLTILLILCGLAWLGLRSQSYSL